MGKGNITKEEIKNNIKLVKNGKGKGTDGLVRKVVKGKSETVVRRIWKVCMEAWGRQ